MNFNQILDKIKELKDEIEESRKLKKEEKNIFIKNINYNNIINEFENLKNLKDKKNIHNINLYEELKINKYLLCLNCYSTIIFEDFNHFVNIRKINNFCHDKKCKKFMDTIIYNLIKNECKYFEYKDSIFDKNIFHLQEFINHIEHNNYCYTDYNLNKRKICFNCKINYELLIRE